MQNTLYSIPVVTSPEIVKLAHLFGGNIPKATAEVYAANREEAIAKIEATGQKVLGN